MNEIHPQLLQKIETNKKAVEHYTFLKNKHIQTEHYDFKHNIRKVRDHDHLTGYYKKAFSL